MVAREPRVAHCLLASRRIEEIDWDTTFRNVEKSGFDRWLPYSFETVEVDHLGELICRRLDSCLCPAVERGFRHAGPYVSWKHGVTRATLESCQSENDAYLATQETRDRTTSDVVTLVEVPAKVARRFHEAGRIVTRTDVELATLCQAIIANETGLRNDRN